MSNTHFTENRTINTNAIVIQVTDDLFLTPSHTLSDLSHAKICKSFIEAESLANQYGGKTRIIALSYKLLPETEP